MNSTLLPFLYHTRTLQRAVRSPIIRLAARGLHAAPARQVRGRRARDNSSIPFDTDARRADEQWHGAEASDADDALSTITPTEKRVFDQIFADLASRGAVPHAAPRAAAPTTTPWTAAATVTAQADGAAPPNTTTLRQQLRELTDPDAALQRYPPSLRRAAEMALGLLSRGDADAGMGAAREGDVAPSRPRAEPDATALRQAREWEGVRNADRERMDALMRASETDKELWDLLDREVFSMPQRLGIMAPTEPTAAQAAVSPATETSTSPPLSLDIHGPLYSEYLLKAFTMLARGFSSPSPLVSHLLPKVKSLGLVPYVLGISTPLFNELATIMWRQRGDLAGVLDLLAEMEYAGLRFDDATVVLLDEMEASLSSMVRGVYGAFPQALGQMPEFEASLRATLSWRLRTIKYPDGHDG